MTMLCEVFEVPRSSVYDVLDAKKGGYPRSTGGERIAVMASPGPGSSSSDPDGGAVKKKGPRTALSDEALLLAIRKVIEESPFSAEGHRKVWARLRVLSEPIRVGRKRVLRLMRLHGLLSPMRFRNTHGNVAHDGTIKTDRPDDMWGTDGTTFETVEDGWCWFFGTIDHCVEDIVGWSVVKKGDRFAALDAIRPGVKKHFGPIGKDVARGLTVRCDHGPQYTSDDLRGELRWLGIEISYAYVGEPQCNGMAEHFMRILKEQCLWIHRFQNLEEARNVIREFIERYNREWILERWAYRTPDQVRRDFQSHPEDQAA
jgi:transposase InsO family protein